MHGSRDPIDVQYLHKIVFFQCPFYRHAISTHPNFDSSIIPSKLARGIPKTTRKKTRESVNWYNWYKHPSLDGTQGTRQSYRAYSMPWTRCYVLFRRLLRWYPTITGDGLGQPPVIASHYPTDRTLILYLLPT